MYFGEVGKESHILIDYFVRNGATPPVVGENPAEWMLGAIGAAPGKKTEIDWRDTWLRSGELQGVRQELERLKVERPHEVEEEKRRKGEVARGGEDEKRNKALLNEFAAPFGTQFVTVLSRIFQQYWRTPSYIWAKIALCTLSVSLACDRLDCGR